MRLHANLCPAVLRAPKKTLRFVSERRLPYGRGSVWLCALTSVAVALCGCGPFAPTGLNEFLNDAASNPDAFESVEVVGADNGQLYLVRNDLPDDFFSNLITLGDNPDDAVSSEQPLLQFDIGAVNLSDGSFTLVADNFITSPTAAASARWIVWNDPLQSGVIVWDRVSGQQATYLASDAQTPSSLYEFLALDGVVLWLHRLDYEELPDPVGVQNPMLLSIDLTTGASTDFGPVFDEASYKVLPRNGALLAFESLGDPWADAGAEQTTDEFSFDFVPPAIQYQLVSFDVATREKTVLVDSLGEGVYPADLMLDGSGRVLWREDDFTANTTTIRAMTLPDRTVTTLTTFTIEAPTLDSEQTLPLSPSGRASSVIAWNERGILIQESEFTGGAEFFPDTAQRYVFRGFDGKEFEVASFSTNGLFLAPITTVVGDTVVVRDVISGELILTNIDSQESKRVAIFQ